jgi:RNA polymerase sigma-70 factor (ECF subfamily)
MTKRENAEWLSDLRASGALRESALSDLRMVIVSGLPYALTQWLSQDDPQFAALVEEVAQETLLRVLAHLDSFEGRSQFTTWVHKIAVRVALTELRKRKWRDVSLETLVTEDAPDSGPSRLVDPGPNPETTAERRDLMNRVQRIIMEELTDKQRQAMMAHALHGMPLEEVARRMGMERNALYKLMHDARLRLKRKLEREGLLAADVLAAFEQG